LALAYRSASGQGLPECQPVLRGITAINDRSPQYKHINARICSPRYCISWQTLLGCRRTPWLRPRVNTGFQLCDNRGGHLFIKRDARTIAASHSAQRCLAAFATTFPFLIIECHHRLHYLKIRRNRPRRGGVGGKQRTREGRTVPGHTRRTVTKRKTPPGVVARGSATLGGSAVHPVSPEPVQTTPAHARRP